MSTGDAPAPAPDERPLRDRPLVRVALLVLVLALAFGVARGCSTRDIALEQDEAVEIARRAVDFEPDLVQVKLLRRGIKSQSTWAVSLSQRRADGGLENVTVVSVDADTGEIEEIRREGPT